MKAKRTALMKICECPECGGDTVYQVNNEPGNRCRVCFNCDIRFVIKYDGDNRRWIRMEQLL
jgi:transcription elongation factor Elf1